MKSISPCGPERSASSHFHSPDDPLPMPESLEPLDRLMRTLTERARSLPEGSYTTKLMRGGVPALGRKIMEEAGEMVEAASEVGEEGRKHFVYEAGDLLYHAMALLAFRGVTLDEIAAELARREGTSGLAEKASRQSRPT